MRSVPERSYRVMRLAIIGDIHKAWDDADAAYFNASDYDALLFVGDLPGRTHRGTLDVARGMSAVNKPALFLPGNHDGVSMMQLLAELQQNRSRIEKKSRGQEQLCAELDAALGAIRMCGYSRHTLTSGSTVIDVVAARPHSMGGDRLAYAPYLERTFGIGSMADSAARILDCIRACENPILILAHNGPTGLGGERNSIWGCDFRKEAGDFGDPDLRMALDQARVENCPVLGVVAGHMHLHVRGLPDRDWCVRQDNLTFVNAARVPRIFKLEGERVHHHIRMTIQAESVQVAEVLISDAGRVIRESAPAQPMNN
ncbi:MAG: metallophosphoesterase [Leptospiraceae bacterium]|nr:metallophosphoesterase [Leptospiraceae bacterium]